MQFTKYKFTGNNFAQEIESANKAKEQLLKITEYPFNFLKEVLLNENIVKHNGELYLKDYNMKGTLSKYEFLNTEEFKKAITYTTRKKIATIK